MIIADTDVISEPLQKEPNPAVVAWLAEHQDELAITSITVGELLRGTRRLPAGRRSTELHSGVQRMIDSVLDRLIPYDHLSARVYASQAVAREAAGRTTSTEDAMIAAIAYTRGASVATRNVKHFEGSDIEVVNPWDHRL